MPQLPHPFPGVGHYQQLCEIAEGMGWKLGLRRLPCCGRWQLVLETDWYRVRVTAPAGELDLDALARHVADRVLA